MSRSALVGIAIAAVLLVGAAVALVTPRLTGASAHEVRIVFPTADGLVDGSDVLLAGAKVGYVRDVQPQQSASALVTIEVSNQYWPLHQGLSADIRPKSLLGEKYVDLHDGPQTGGTFLTSQVIHAPSQAAPVELDQFINSLDAPTRTAIHVLLDDLGSGVAARGQDLNAAIAAGRQDLANLAVTGKTLNQRDPDLDKILVGLDGVLSQITTSDQLTQMSQLINNGQLTLQDIESVQQSFSRQFNDANVALGDLNVALDGAVPSLRSTIDIAPTLLNNLQQESTLLAQLGASVTTTQNKSPNGECTSATTANQPITQVTGLTQCSPLWELLKGLVQGPSVSAGAVEHAPTGRATEMFRICIVGLPPQVGTGACDNSNASQPAARNFLAADGALFSALLGS